jgi:hypothetical protein
MKAGERRKIHTFYMHVDGLNWADEIKLILLWKQQWASMGWEPIVLGEYDVLKHPLYPQFRDAIDKLPSVNPGQYEQSCYLRWLAMSTIGGVMSDYDVFCYDPKWRASTAKGLTVYQNYCPALVSGIRADYLKVVEEIMRYKVLPEDNYEGKPHISDMYMLAKGFVDFRHEHQVKDYTEAGWEESRLVHYCNRSMIPSDKYPRYKFVSKLRPNILQKAA